MKSEFLLILSVLPFNCMLAQTTFSNPSFENCNTSGVVPCFDRGDNPTCGYIPDKNSQFDYVTNWQSICNVDWYCDDFGFYDVPNSTWAGGCDNTQIINAKTGTHFAGLYNQEAIIYDFGSNLQVGYYSVEFWTNSCEEQWKVRAFGSTNKPSSGSQCEIVANNITECGTQTFTYSSTWQRVVMEFNTVDKPVRYFTVTGDRHGYGCINSDYFFIDAFSINYSPCKDCPQYQLFQNCNLHSLYCEREDYIKAGANVGAPNVNSGPVTILESNKVTFRAGNFISIEPGFNTQPGAILDLSIQPCENDATNYQDCNFAPIAVPTGVVITCNGNDLGASFYSHGCATEYWVHIYNSWGGLMYSGGGDIVSTLTTFYNGLGPHGPPPTTGVYIVYLTLRNCDRDTGIQYSINVVGIDCPSKWEGGMEKLLQGYNHSESSLTVYPNPSNSYITIDLNLYYPSEVYITVLNLYGQHALKCEKTSATNTFQRMLDIQDLPNGTYLIQIETDREILHQRFTVTK